MGQSGLADDQHMAFTLNTGNCLLLSQELPIFFGVQQVPPNASSEQSPRMLNAVSTAIGETIPVNNMLT